jgi:hypothetical protein
MLGCRMYRPFTTLMALMCATALTTGIAAADSRDALPDDLAAVEREVLGPATLPARMFSSGHDLEVTAILRSGELRTVGRTGDPAVPLKIPECLSWTVTPSNLSDELMTALAPALAAVGAPIARKPAPSLGRLRHDDC